LRRKISDREKSEIVDLHLQGLTRDQIAKKTGGSAGGVSGALKEFTDCADSSSLDDAAEEYDVVETVESLRSLAVAIRKAGTSVEELTELSNMLGRIKKLIDLDKLEGFIKAGESLGDKAHVEASVRMCAIEERTGKSHDEILSDLEGKEARVRELSSEVQSLQSQMKNLNAEKERAQANFNDEKAKLEAELAELLKQHGLTLERIDHISKIQGVLSRYGIALTQLEELQRVLNAVEEADQDAKRLVELAKKVGSLRAQAEAEAKELDETRELAAKLDETILTLEERLKEAELVMEKCHDLESMGWSLESLEKAIKLSREAGSLDEVLNRLELLKPSAKLRADLDRAKAEVAEMASEKSRLQRGYEALKRRCEDLEDATNALKELFMLGFNKEIMLSIRDEALKYGSMLQFMEVFGRCKHREEMESDIKEKEERLKAVSGELGEKTARLNEVEAKLETVALRVGELKAEMELREKMLLGLKVIFALTNEPRSLTTDSITWLTDRILIWAKSKQEEVKKRGNGSELKVGSYADWLCESLRKLKERGY